MTETISRLAGRVGVSPGTIRYYEQRGLLPTPVRSSSGYRLYDAELAERVRFIRNAQRTGLSLGDIRELLEIMDRGACPCGHTELVVRRRLDELDAELRRLQTMRSRLETLDERNRGCTGLPTARWWCATTMTEGGEGT